MPSTLTVVLILIVIWLVWTGMRHPLSESLVTMKDKNGFAFLIQSAFPDKDESLKVMSDVNEFNINLLRHLRDKYGAGAPLERASTDSSGRAERTRNLISRYDMDKLLEVDPANSKNETAYTVDKGEELGMCLRSKYDKEHHSMDVLYFVSMHELAHMAVSEYGHTNNFWATFQWLMKEAQAAGLFAINGLPKEGFEYCGVDVRYNPMKDFTIVGI